MSGADLVFILLAIVCGASAVAVVTSRNLFYAALFLATSLASIAGVFLVLQADFLALVQLVVYVGAIAVLLTFGLMLTRAPIGREALDSQNRTLGLIVAGGLFAVLAVLIVQAFKDAASAAATGPGPADLGMVLFSTWVFPFELVSMLLLGALVGAIVLSRRESGESGEGLETSVPLMAEAPESDSEESDAGEAEREEVRA